ncbi:hypothetical protein DFH06DRAFT_1347483 [Mycena polygramma]|nr:hypothetical protein DFH06DRAFT_1347483 [Mycena polygramma]
MTHLPPSEASAAGDNNSGIGAADAYRMLSQASAVMAATLDGAPASSPAPPSSPDAPTPAPWTAPRGVQLTGPWVAGAVYGVVPAGPLAVVPEANQVHTGKWYAITRGRYVGVTHSTAICDAAVTRVSHGLRAVYDTQYEAVQAFNDALEADLDLIEVIA